MNEATLKGKMGLRVRKDLPTFVFERTEDKFTHGTPDVAITGNKICSRWEVKYAHPTFYVKGIQELTMLRLAKQGYAWFLIFYEKEDTKRTIIVPPDQIRLSIIEWPDFVMGFDFDFVVNRIRDVHNGNYKV